MIFYSLLAVVFLSPLPYGANRPWAWNLCALLIAVLGIVWAIQFFIKKFDIPIKSIGDIIALFLLVLCWAWMQSSFNSFSDFQHPLWRLQNELFNTFSGFISLIPDDTLMSMMRLLSYALVFWLSLYYSQTIANARQILYGLMIVGFIYSLYGLFIHLGDIKLILWQQRLDTSSVSSTFINRNHFATFAGLNLLCTLALVYEGVSDSSKYNIGGNIGLQRFMENLIIRTWFPLLVFIVIGTALILTHSRGGFLSSLVGLLVLLIALNVNKHSRNLYMLWVFSAFIILGGLIFYISSEGLLMRLDTQGLTDPFRDKVYQLTWTAILTNPWLGFGLGSFEEAFTLYKSLDVAGSPLQPSLWDYAHNTYLETIFELGFPAAIALFYCFFKMAWICLKGLLIRRRNWIYSATGLAATCLIATHAFVDFSMQIPAVAYTYCLLMGAACAQSFSSVKNRTSMGES